MNFEVSNRYADKVAVVTGGASGIGEATARRLVAEGAQVVVGDINEQGLAALAADLDSIVTLRCDVTDSADVAALVALAVERFGRLDTAFNIAGATRVAPIVDLTEEDWDWTVDLCLRSVFLCMKHEARQMLAQGGGGAIVNVSSLNSEVPAYNCAAYCAAKSGAAMLGECGALEWAAQGIRVNTVSPGLIKTNFMVNGESTGSADRPAAIEEAFLERIPMGDPGIPDQVAAACSFLGSDDANYVTGINMMVRRRMVDVHLSRSPAVHAADPRGRPVT